MDKNRTFKIFPVFVVSLVFVFSLHGCFKEIVQGKQQLPDIIWPDPPEIPRIRFLDSISEPKLRETISDRFIDFLKGKESGALNITTPYGITKDRHGALFVIDNSRRLVHVFDEKNNNYFSFPGKETSLMSPIGITIDNNDTIYISDSADAVVKIFREQGKKYSGELGRGLLKRPTGIAFNNKTDELLVVDTLRSEIIRYDIVNYKVKGIIGSEGNRNGLFHSPTNITVSGDGHIIVSDSLNFRVQVLTQDGEFVNVIGRAGDSPGFFSRPKGVAVDSDGNIYVVDAMFDNVQIFNKQGKLLMDFGGPGKELGNFWLPSGIFIDSEDRIYVSDSYNHRVQIFEYLKESDFSTPRH